MSTNKHVAILFAAIIFAAAFWTGCGVGVNPLLFDGSPVSAQFTASTVGNSYADSTTIALHDVLLGIDKQVDSITVFNVTLLIDSLRNGTLASTTVTGSGSIDGIILLTLTNVPLSTFSSERSIFDPSLGSLPGGASFSFNPAGVAYLNGLLKHPDALPASVKVRVGGTASQSGLYFDVTLKLYTQIFAKQLD